MPSSLESLLRPETIAVLGASRDPHKWGQRVIRYTLAAGFPGEILAVNPNAAPGDIPGATVVASLEQAEAPVSCAFLAVPRDRVLAEVERCCALRVPTVVVAASGFGESSAEGAEIERRMVALARASGTRLVGPNCFGVFSAQRGVNLTPFEYPPHGRVAMVSQSGNLAAELFLEAARARIGFSHCIGIGNQIDVGFGDLLTAFADDPGTEAVALYVEGLQTGAGPAFVAGLHACRAAGKPVVVIKAGASRLAAAVAQTHTRSLAADDRVWETVLEQCEAIRVWSVPEMIDVLRCAVSLRSIGPRVAVVTDGGGDSVLALDGLSRTRLQPAVLTPATIATLEVMIPPAAPRSPGMNPLTLDTAGGVEDDPQILARCAQVVAEDPGTDVVILSGLFGTYQDARDEEIKAALALRDLAAAGGAALVFHAPLPPAESEPLALLADAGVPIFDSLDRAMRAVDRLVPAPEPGTRPGLSSPAGEALGGPRPWPVLEAAARLRRFGVAVPRIEVVSDRAALFAAVDELGYPVCLKTADPDVVHKSDVGGVHVNLETPVQVGRAAEQLWVGDPASPVLVMPSFPRGFELLVGGFTDPCFGPVVMIGRGGVLAEVEADTALVSGDISCEAVLTALTRLRCYPVLRGYRGSPALAVDAVAELVVALGGALRDDPSIAVDLNPVLLYADRCAIADVRVMSEKKSA
ncbi:MAG TPA: acetate--CoA ligase family protein [Actinomycetes bacterium]|nr:acetate--CoA ligase family protein [Actinomycetes bacterium]